MGFLSKVFDMLVDVAMDKAVDAVGDALKNSTKITVNDKEIFNNSDDSNDDTPISQDFGFQAGDIVRFKDDALVYYNAENGKTENLAVKHKKTNWTVRNRDSSNNLLTLYSQYYGTVKAKPFDVVLFNSSLVAASHGFSVGDSVQFKSDSTIFYDAKNGSKQTLSVAMKNMTWKVEKLDPYNEKFVFLKAYNGAEAKAKTSALTLIKQADLNTSESVQQVSTKKTVPASQKNVKKESNMGYQNNYNGYQFTALGLSGSGKTCFMAGMYYKMSGGVEGYTLKADDDDSVSLTDYYEQMTNAASGADRFPGGTNQSTDYAFELQYGYKTLEKFRWIDYAGGTLKSKNAGDAEEYQQLKNDIAKSEMLYIFVDGSVFQDDELEDASSDSEKIEIITDAIMDSCSRQINHFLSEYTSERGKLPPIAIVITKYDLAVKALNKATTNENMELLYKIIQRAFNPLFPDPNLYTGDDGHTSMVGIIPVSLGMKISEGNYTGKLRPINMHLPAYIGIWFMLKNSQNSQESAMKKLADAIEDSGVKFWLNGQTGKFSTLAEGYLRKMKEGK